MTGYCPASFWKGKKILFGVTGGIAAYKAAGIVSFLIQAGAEVQVVMTEHARQFVGKCTFETLTRRPVYTDLFVPGEKILHISLVRECDWVVIAPATANIIGKMAAGIGDDLLSTLLLVDLPKVIVTPAMNTG
ncbi:MAG: flavoprotein, partial [Atribacterota bacterium]